jgi:ribose-phosphate pyrophosphokinase
LHALRELAAHFAHTDVSNTVVVSPDFGNIKPASRFAELLGVPVAAGAKQRLSDDKVVISSIIGDVAGRDIIVIDDEIAGGATIFELLDHMKALGAGPSRVVCTHGLFVGDVLERLQDHPDVTEIVSTNTVPISPAKQVPDLTVISVAPALAEAIRRIHAGESVSALFH